MIIGYQDWSELLFVHWRIASDALRPHVHRRLSIDERDGSGWVSMTPFTLRRGRLRGLPPLPDFHELNFRTYVTLPGGASGIWFFSLDAANALAVAAARLSARLPYFPARIECGERWYRSERRLQHAHFEARWTISGPEFHAAPGSIEEFLCERYSLYSPALGPLLWRGPVRHDPWPLMSAQIKELREDLSAAAGLPPLGEPSLAHWSPGVSVAFEHFRPC
ncbi:MAG: DUF2071 domain-containing protein [Deltaproteobacteria bacterium]|nr:MAG: DUF2071 domain-containing protein [Deltaproteobacteria bacterium]